MTFDDLLRKAMSDYLVAVNRLRHAQGTASSPDAVARLRELATAETEAERACAQALIQRGWQPPYAMLPVGV